MTATHSLHNTTVAATAAAPLAAAQVLPPQPNAREEEVDLIAYVSGAVHSPEQAAAREPLATPATLEHEHILLDIETGEVVSKTQRVLVIQDRVYSVNTQDHSHWHCPANEREYNQSPQRALWRTAKELKMDQYEAINTWTLVPRPPGAEVLRTTWAYAIKTTDTGMFHKLGTRVCVVGTGMDREIYNAYSDVMRMSSLKTIAAIRGAYYTQLISFQADVSDAFQSTRIDGPEHKDMKPIYVQQAKGFEKYGPNGQHLVCRLNVTMQGLIHAASTFSTRLNALLEQPGAGKIGLRRSVWDPKVYIYHHGPLANSDASLDKILSTYQGIEQPPSTEAPIGWGMIGIHVDDLTGVVSSAAVQSYILELIQVTYGTTSSPWTKVLGFKITCDDSNHTVTLSADAALADLHAKHLAHRICVSPKHPCPSTLDLEAGIAPDATDPRLAAFKEMQAETCSILGKLLWLGNAYPMLLYPTVRGCEFMSNPGWSVHKLALHISMYATSHAVPLVYGGLACTSLILSEPTVLPFTSGRKEYGLHCFADAGLMPKSITGGTIMLAGASILDICQRQHLEGPSSHAVEVVAASSVLHALIPIRKCYKSAAFIKCCPRQCILTAALLLQSQTIALHHRSVWLQRRTIVLNEAVDLEEVRIAHISEADNIADPNTKYNKHLVMVRHQHYKCNVAGDPPGTHEL